MVALQYPFELESYIRGDHAYQDLWQPTAGQILECYQEADNVEDNEAI